MHYEGIAIEGIGAATGDLILATDAIRDGRYSYEQAQRSGQESITVAAGATGPQLAVRAGRQVLLGNREHVDLHLHATIHDPGLDFWSASAYVADQLAVDTAMSISINAMSNSVLAGLELAAGLVSARRSGSALITAGDTFAAPRFDCWQGDSGIVYGDGGSALLISHRPSPARVADLVATASYTDAALEGLHRGNDDWHSGDNYRPPVRLRERKLQWLATHGGVDELDRRNAVGVITVTKQALYDAGLELDDLRWVLCPHYGDTLLERQCLAPLGITTDQTTAHLGRRFGHLGASDQIVDLHHLIYRRLLDDGDYVMLLGIGVGMTWTAAILRHHRHIH